MVHSGTPDGVLTDTDCAIRRAAFDYGKRLQPQKGAFAALYDALQLSSCGVPAPAAADVWLPLGEPLPSEQRVLYVAASGVAPREGDYPTLAAAVAASRRLIKPLTIALRQGTHFLLSGAILLNALDSGLTIRNFPGERAVLSGGRPISPLWKPSAVCGDGCFEASLSGQVSEVPGLRRDGEREIRARYPNFDPERDAVINGTYMVHDGRSGMINATTTWIASGARGMNGYNGTWPPTATAQAFVVDARDWPSVDWPMAITTNGSADRDSFTGEGSWGEFWVGVGGSCADREPPAGYWCAPGAPRHISAPNHASGIVLNRSQLPHLPYGRPEGAVVHSWGYHRAPPPHRTRPSPHHRTCSRCAEPRRVVVGGGRLVEYSAMLTVACLTMADWYSSIYEIGGQHGVGNFTFSRGGTQGAEGSPSWGTEFYVENVLEELDSEREWFFDNVSRTLYYRPNATELDAIATGDEGASQGFVVTHEPVLLNLSGSRQLPIRDVTIEGLELRDTPQTYFAPHGLPSGGDWALAPQGAISISGSEGVDIRRCLLTRLDGNGIYAGEYNRNLTIRSNEFTFIGESAMASWGSTSVDLSEAGSKPPLPHRIGPDGRSGDQPRGVRVVGNIVREIGIWQKQSSAWFQAVTAQTLLEGNVFFNGPRAAINFNDHFGGGDRITNNLLLNMVRESKDHGPFNAWDRNPSSPQCATVHRASCLRTGRSTAT